MSSFHQLSFRLLLIPLLALLVSAMVPLWVGAQGSGTSLGFPDTSSGANLVPSFSSDSPSASDSEFLLSLLDALEPVPPTPPSSLDDAEFILSLLDGSHGGDVLVRDMTSQPSAIPSPTAGSGSQLSPPSDFETERIMPSASPWPADYVEPGESPTEDPSPEFDIADEPVPEPTPAISDSPPSPTPHPDPTLRARLLAFDQAILPGALPPECPPELQVNDLGDSGSGTILFPLDPDGSTKELTLGILPTGIDVHFDKNGARIIRVDRSETFVRIEAFRTLDSAQQGDLSVPVLFTRSWSASFSTVCSLSLRNFFTPPTAPLPEPELQF